MSELLKNKVSIVTGGGSGIGKSIASIFAASGSKIYLFDINEDQGTSTCDEINKSGGNAEFIYCNIADPVNVKKAVEKALENESRIDILVNNAGISHVGNIEQTTTEDMDKLFNVNVKGMFHVTKEIIPQMVKSGGGVILNLASIVAKVGIAERFAYTMTKGAVLSMTLSIAKDYIDKNIRCNCICPARVHTPFVDDYLAKNYSGREEEVFENLSKFQPIGRMGKPDEIAKFALFLCSDDSSFITGATYDIDGGVMNLR
ncbi:MAG: SDR family oxidoreductase [Ignavibacteriae bacterium]|nr:SDR family oxidoreductase [Ignavibacteriota bacterium]NOG97735.1 SDR family oxidoreductase [Ignavibacteriota bacterium]